MAAQSFFYETKHTNYGMMFDEDSEQYIDTVLDIKEQAKALDTSNTDIYKVVAQYSSNNEGFQIFVAPYIRYSELAEDILDRFKATGNVYFKDKNKQNRQIRKQEFVKELNRIVINFGSNKKVAISKISALIQEHFEKQVNKLEKAVAVIANEYDMGLVKYQEHYSGLATTWIESKK